MTSNRNRSACVVGLDFGTESVRALVADIRTGELASVAVRYPHGQIIDTLPGSRNRLPPSFALQHPADWLESAAKACRAALRKAKVRGETVIGLGVDFTSCTMLPTKRDGLPLCLIDRLRREPHAWPKLWKHHGAQSQADRITHLARMRGEPLLERYGGVIGLEWFFPKVLETIESAPAVAREAEVWLEAGDWLVWQLVGGEAATLPRSTCQAGYKGMWHAVEGYPSETFLEAVHPGLREVVREKMPGQLLAPGQKAGGLTASQAKRFGLPAGIAVSAAIIDAHAGVPGAGAADPGTLVMVMGTSSCHMLNSLEEKHVAGVAGVVRDGILPGFYGYETGQAAVGDAFDWLRRLTGQPDFQMLGREAAKLPPGAEGLLCVDWFHGCRTPLMNGNLRGLFHGLSLHHRPEHLYRAMLEGSAMGLRWIVELLREGGVPVKKLVATGGLPHHNPLVVQVYADVLGEPIVVHPSRNGPALGAAILGAMAAKAFASPRAAIRALATPRDQAVRRYLPNREHHQAYAELYQSYRKFGDFISR
jgi:L-ribulokinase